MINPVGAEGNKRKPASQANALGILACGSPGESAAIGRGSPENVYAIEH
jgi:hypothetical protein